MEQPINIISIIEKADEMKVDAQTKLSISILSIAYNEIIRIIYTRNIKIEEITEDILIEECIGGLKL